MAAQPSHWREDALQPPTQVQQTTVHIPVFEIDLPLIQTDDEEAFYPIPAICQTLDIAAGHYLRRWKQQLLWDQARKLPWYIPGHGERVVWCLETDALPGFLVYCPHPTTITPVWQRAHDFIDAFVEARHTAMERQLHDDQRFLRDMHTLLRICSKLNHIIDMHNLYSERAPASLRARFAPLAREVLPHLDPARRLALQVIADFEHSPNAKRDGSLHDRLLHVVNGFSFRIGTQVSHADRDAAHGIEERLAFWCREFEEIMRDQGWLES